MCEIIDELPSELYGYNRESLSANFIVINSTGEDVLYELLFSFPEGQNTLALVQLLNDNNYELEYLTEKGDSIHYISHNSLSELKEIVLIPVVTS